MNARSLAGVCCAAAIVPLACLGMLAGCGGRPAAEKPAGSAGAPAGPGSAALELAWQPGGSTLDVVIRNTGRSPIKVDKELLLLVQLTLRDPDGQPVDMKGGGALPRPDSFAGRFISVASGQAVRRTVNLKEGFPQFQWGWGTVMNGEHFYQIPNAYVSVLRLPEDARPTRVEVSYGPGGFMYRDGFKFHTGLELDALGLYLGPLSKTIELAR